MNIFSSGPTAAETQRENFVKSQLTENLKEAIRELQRTHISSEHPIFSGDITNAVCNVLEAVFLHGLKSPVSKKLSYLAGYSNNINLLSFWGLLQTVTHRDTLSQLNRLGQITTEVGMCRAWIRLALNDGVLESYLHALLEDNKTLRQYYTRLAYLRDVEQPGIFISFIQSLSALQFQLSYNSSVLNIWTHTPLMLAGLISSHTDPRPVMPTSHGGLQSTATSTLSPVARRPDQLTSRPVNNKSNKTPSKPRNAGSHVAAIIPQGSVGSQQPLTPPNTPYDPSQLTRSDIEAIRELASTERKSNDSSSTGTSQISHPDPVDARLLEPNLPELCVYPFANSTQEVQSSHVKVKSKDSRRMKVSKMKHMIVDNGDISEAGNSQNQMKKLLDSSPKSHVSPQQVVNIDQEKQDASRIENNYKNPFEIESCDDPIVRENAESNNPFHEPYDQSLNPFEARSGDLGEMNESSQIKSGAMDVYMTTDNSTAEIPHTVVDYSKSEVRSNTKDSSSVNTEFTRRSKISDKFAVVHGSLQAGNSEIENQNGSSIYDSFVTDPNDSDSKLSGADDFMLSTESEAPSTSDQPVMDETPTASHRKKRKSAMRQSASFPKLDLGKSPPLEPELSTVMATSDRVELASEALTGLSSSLNDNAPSIWQEADKITKSNSLGLMEGWSSDFETSMQTGELHFLPDVHNPLMTSVNESFDNMLHNYGSSLGGVGPPSMSEVLGSLPDEGSMDDNVLSQTATSESAKLRRESTIEEELIDEYEILPDLLEKRAYLSDPKFQPLLEIIGTICTEKGLDMQNYQCKGCSRPVGMFYGNARVCTFDAGYYCYECHENSESYIPSRIVFNWDFRKFKVCRQNLEFLQQSEDDQLLNVQTLNPKLYNHVHEMGEIKNIRIQLRFLKSYLFTCKQSVADELRRQVWPKEYYYDDVHLYSMNDFLQVATGQLAQNISRIVKNASKHIYDCGLCSQKGFVCEICNNPKVIYPFEMESTVRCERCNAVYHKDCKTPFRRCPKCERRQQRQSKLGVELGTPDSTVDYAFSPTT